MAVKDPEYVKKLVTHHVGGYLKIAPEHSEEGVLSKMMQPGMGSYDKFKQMFEQYSQEAGKEQYLIPYFIAAHPGTTDEDMMNLALWLKRNDFRTDQVQAFYPSPMATATATATTMYHTHKDPLHKVTRSEGDVEVVKSGKQNKAFLRYHDPKNWGMLRAALKHLGREDLIGTARHCLVLPFNSRLEGGDAKNSYQSARKKNSRVGSGSAKRQNHNPKAAGNKSASKPVRNQHKKVKKGNFQTQHTGLPPRATK